MIVCGLLFGGAGYFFANEAINNDRGVIIDNVITLDTGGATIFYWILAGLSAGFVLIAIAAMLRTYLSPKVLRLEIDSLSLPHGFLHRQISRIHYSSIDRISETEVSGQKFLYLHTRDKRYSLVRSMLPSDQIYKEIRDFLSAQVERH